MVKKKTIPLYIINVILLLVPFFTGFGLYKYRRLVLNRSSLISIALLLGIVAVFDIVLVVTSFVLKKAPTLIKLISLILVFIIMAYAVLTFSGLFIAGDFWKSQTDDFSIFKSADPSLNDCMKIADMTINDIIALEIVNVENFHYYYQAYMLHESFEFKGYFVFSEEHYTFLKSKFENAPEFNYEPNPSTSYIPEMTGCFEFDEEIPMYESKTAVDSWDKVVVECCDSNNSFYFDLVGTLYT